MTILSRIAAGLSMPMTFAVPSKRKLSLRLRVHSDSRSCRILSAVASETQHVQDCDGCFPPAEQQVHNTVNWMFTWMVNVWSTTRTQWILVYWTLSYREHPSHSAAKLKSRNNVIGKLAGTLWGASARHPHTSALALCYSIAEYCCPVWARSSYTNVSLDHFNFVFSKLVLLSLVFFCTAPRIGWEKRFWNDLFYVEWDVKPCPISIVNCIYCL